MNNYWISDKEYKLIESTREASFRMLFNPEGIKVWQERKNRNRDNLKMAYIYVGKTHKPAWVDTKTGKAFKMGERYEKTTMPIPRFKFDRWMRPMDV